MKCPQVRRRLAARVHGELSPSEERLVQAHLARCPACQRAFSAVADLHERLGALPRFRSPSGLRDRIETRLRSLDAPPNLLQSVRVRWAVALTAVALAVGASVMAVRTPRLDLVEVRAPVTHESMARDLHARRLNGQLALSLETTDVPRLRDWAEKQIGLRPAFAADPMSCLGEIRFEGAASTEGPALVFFMTIDEQPVSLLMQRKTADSVDEGSWAKKIFFRATPSGRKTLVWSTKDTTYVLVSDLPGYGQAGCLGCHRDSERQRLITAMRPRSWRPL